MICARLTTACPDCDALIQPGDMIGQIGLYFVCSECFKAFEAANHSAPPVILAPISGQWEPV